MPTLQEREAAARAATTMAGLCALYVDAIGLECVDVEGMDPGQDIEAARAAVLEMLAEEDAEA